MVPEGWEQHALSDVARVIDCKHRTPKYVELGVPLVSLEQLNGEHWT